MDDPCPICFMVVDKSTGHCTLSCEHTFHFQCIAKWSSKNASCPLCRKEVKDLHDPEPQVALVDTRFRHEVRPIRLVNLGDVRVTEEDIEFVMDQSGATRGEVCNALREFDGDVSDALAYVRVLSSVLDRPEHGPDDFDVPTDDQRAFWGLRALLDPTPPIESHRNIRWRGGRGSTGGRLHTCVHWKHLDGVYILDVDGYDTD
jgi:Ring finger domain/HYPK UBA domain